MIRTQRPSNTRAGSGSYLFGWWMLAIGFLALSGCGAPLPPPEPGLIKEAIDARILEHEDYLGAIDLVKACNVEQEVTAALKRQDQRFIAVMGYGMMLPGIEGGVNDALFRQAARNSFTMPGTSDCVDAGPPSKWQGVAYDFAKRYNLSLIEQLKIPQTTDSNRGD